MRERRTRYTQRAVTARQPTFNCGTVTVSQTPAFDPALVNLTSCHLNQGDPIDVGLLPIDAVVSGEHTWQNDNPGDGNAAFIRAQVHLGGMALPISIDASHDFRRQVDATTYELLVADDGSTHPVGYDVAAADLPLGQDMQLQIVTQAVENRAHDQF